MLIDTDVLLDVLSRREPFAGDSAALLAACETGRCRGLVAAHSVTTLAYLLGRHRGPAGARELLSRLLRVVDAAAVDHTVIDQALASGAPDFEDAVGMAAAASARADYIATRNVRHFSAGPVLALSPAELLPLLATP